MSWKVWLMLVIVNAIGAGSHFAKHEYGWTCIALLGLVCCVYKVGEKVGDR